MNFCCLHSKNSKAGNWAENLSNHSSDRGSFVKPCVLKCQNWAKSIHYTDWQPDWQPDWQMNNAACQSGEARLSIWRYPLLICGIQLVNLVVNLAKLVCQSGVNLVSIWCQSGVNLWNRICQNECILLRPNQPDWIGMSDRIIGIRRYFWLTVPKK